MAPIPKLGVVVCAFDPRRQEGPRFKARLDYRVSVRAPWAFERGLSLNAEKFSEHRLRSLMRKIKGRQPIPNQAQYVLAVSHKSGSHSPYTRANPLALLERPGLFQ